jgi:hypothetical protein
MPYIAQRKALLKSSRILQFIPLYLKLLVVQAHLGCVLGLRAGIG